MSRPRSAHGGTGRPRSKTSTTITVTHEHVPRWVESAKRAGMSPPQYVASVLDGQATAWGDAWRAGYESALAHASEAVEGLRGTLPKPGPARRLGPDDAAPR